MAKGSREESARSPPRIYIAGDEIEAVEEFVYLGSLLTTPAEKFRGALWLEIVLTPQNSTIE